MNKAFSISERCLASLSTDRVLLLDGYIDCSRAESLINQINRMVDSSKDPIILIFDCEGGNSNLCFKLYEEIERCRDVVAIHGFVTGKCFAMGLVLLQACSKRISLFESVFILQRKNGRGFYAQNPFKSHGETPERPVSFNGDSDERIKSVILSRSRLGDERYIKIIESGDIFDKEISAIDALESGLIDQISADISSCFF